LRSTSPKHATINRYSFAIFDGWLYFTAADSATGTELWRTNGTTTSRVADIQTGVNGSGAYDFTIFGGWLYFSAYDEETGYEVWRTNGVSTARLIDLRTGADSSSANEFVVLGDWLYFTANDGISGVELWRTNGTTTTRVTDIQTGVLDSYPSYATALGDWLYFAADDGTATSKLWRLNIAGEIESVPLPGTNAFIGCMCNSPITTLNERLFATFGSDETGLEFLYLDESTFGLPETSRDGSVWSTALVLLAALTAVTGVGIRIQRRHHAR
jgi:ELWxxDGT repeat protein